MSLPDIQLHLSRSFCWHTGLSYGTRNSPQMKTRNNNLTLLTTVTNSKATKQWDAEEGTNYYSLRFSHTCKPYTCNLTDTKLVGYKIMRGSRNFCRGGGGGPCPTARNGQHIFLLLLFCPQLILQFIEGVQWFDYRENYITILFQGSRRGLTFSRGGGGSNFFLGVIIVISKETHIM